VADDSTETGPSKLINTQRLRLNLEDNAFDVFNLNGKHLGVVKNGTQGRISLQESLRKAGLNAGTYLIRSKDSNKMLRVNLR
jgi:hypothetical protein